MTRIPHMIHATTVAVDGRGVIILGPSGAGKSALALRMIALGAVLVADDQTCVQRQGSDLVASSPAPIAGQIEAREVGLIHMADAGPTPLRLVVDLTQTEHQRLPHPHQHTILDHPLPCLHKSEKSHFPEAIMLYVKDRQRFPDADS